MTNILEQFQGQTYRTHTFGKNVYTLSDKYVAKAIPNWNLYSQEELSSQVFPIDKSVEYLKERYQLRKQAYELGISQGLNTPKPEGVYLCMITDTDKEFLTLFKPKNVPSLVTERIYGIFPYMINGQKEYLLAHDKLKEQIDTAEKLGFVPFDSDWSDNSIWNSKEKKITIVDVDDWIIKINQENNEKLVKSN